MKRLFLAAQLGEHLSCRFHVFYLSNTLPGVNAKTFGVVLLIHLPGAAGDETQERFLSWRNNPVWRTKRPTVRVEMAMDCIVRVGFDQTSLVNVMGQGFRGSDEARTDPGTGRP